MRNSASTSLRMSKSDTEVSEEVLHEDKMKTTIESITDGTKKFLKKEFADLRTLHPPCVEQRPVNGICQHVH